MIPLNDLVRDQLDIQDEIEKRVLKVLRSGRYIMGEEVAFFEDSFSSFLFDPISLPENLPISIATSSGTDALLMALMALELHPDEEVIIPSFSFGAPAEVVKRVGAIVRFADVDEETFNMTAQTLEASIGPQTKAVIVVHLFGQCAAMNEITTLCRERGLFLIEDCAQAIGATHHHQPAGTMGDVGCFSFYPTKNIGACGDAGALVTRNRDLAERIKLIRNHGYKHKYRHEIIGGNFRMDEIQAAILNVKLPHLLKYTKRRREIADYFSCHFKKINSPTCLEGNYHVYHRYVVRSKERDALIEKLNAFDIRSEVYYPKALHEQSCFDAPARLRISEKLCEESLALPLFHSMLPSEMEQIVDLLER